MSRRRPPDLEEYVRSARERCFICAIATGEDTRHHVVYSDGRAIAFLNRFPTLEGHTIVAPREHREQVTGDFSAEEYVELHRAVYRVAEGVRTALAPERVYILSLGSQAANAHVHWHVVPLPQGMPFERQQLAALSWDEGYLDLSDDEFEAIAARIRRAFATGT
ncbi:MAG: HIT family protein [Actinomycetota bacterium]|nr:HIT family protein [Actinomycetota bacterium]